MRQIRISCGSTHNNLLEMESPSSLLNAGADEGSRNFEVPDPKIGPLLLEPNFGLLTFTLHGTRGAEWAP